MSKYIFLEMCLSCIIKLAKNYTPFQRRQVSEKRDSLGGVPLVGGVIEASKNGFLVIGVGLDIELWDPKPTFLRSRINSFAVSDLKNERVGADSRLDRDNL